MNSIPYTMKLYTILVFFLLVISIDVANSSIDGFIQCLPTKSNSSNPISNSIFTRSNPSFKTVLQKYIKDSRFNTSTTPKPLAIVTALDVTHVQATVLCAKANALQIRIRSGGHDFEGMSYISKDPFVVLDLFNLRSINIDLLTQTATVQAGATLGELYYHIAKKNSTLAFPAGVCLTLGTGGHFSGAGYGPLIRKFGLSIDHIIDAQVVDANGRVLDRESMGEDLFWAIRGGGGASFCVILSWTIKLVPVPPIVTVFNVKKTLQQGATDIVLEWQRIATKIDRNLFIRVQPITKSINGTKTVQVSFIGMYLGRRTTLLKLINPNFPKLGLQLVDCIETTHVRSHLFWNEIEITNPVEVLLERTVTGPHKYSKHKSDFVKTPISRTGLETIWQKMIEVDNVLMQWNPYGGRMSEIPENATAFPHRHGNLFKMQYIKFWQDDGDRAILSNVQKTRDLYNTFTPFVSRNPRAAFLNYRDVDIGTNLNGYTGTGLGFATDYFKGNVKRLVRVKGRVDPTNFFRYEQSIPPIQTTSFSA